jgi:hypothetical protein
VVVKIEDDMIPFCCIDPELRFSERFPVEL